MRPNPAINRTLRSDDFSSNLPRRESRNFVETALQSLKINRGSIAPYPDMGLKWAHARDRFIQPESLLGK